MTKIFDINPKIDEIQTECFYEFRQGFEFWNKLMILMKQPQTKTKIKGLLLKAPPDGGKSTLVEQFQYEYLLNVKNAKEGDVRIFKVPQGVGAVQVFAQLCSKLGIPDIPVQPRNYPITHFVLKASLKIKKDVKLLIVDEFQNLYELQPNLRKRIISAFNQLINECRVPIVLVGLNDVNEIINNIDDDLSNLKGTFSSRFQEYELNRWFDNEEFQGLLISIYKDLHLNSDSKPFYYSNNIREKILEYSEGLLGRIVTLLKESAINILQNKLPENITLEILKETAIELGYHNKNEIETKV